MAYFSMPILVLPEVPVGSTFDHYLRELAFVYNPFPVHSVDLLFREMDTWKVKRIVVTAVAGAAAFETEAEVVTVVLVELAV